MFSYVGHYGESVNVFLEHFKGTKAMTRGMEAIGFVASSEVSGLISCGDSDRRTVESSSDLASCHELERNLTTILLRTSDRTEGRSL